MSVTATPVFAQTPKCGMVQVVNADGTNSKIVYTAGANGSKITALLAASNDSSARIFLIRITRSAVNYVLTAVSIPANSGTDGTAPSVDLLSSSMFTGLPVDNDGQKYLLLESGDTLTVALSTSAVTSGKTVHFKAIGADF